MSELPSSANPEQPSTSKLAAFLEAINTFRLDEAEAENGFNPNYVPEHAVSELCSSAIAAVLGKELSFSEAVYLLQETTGADLSFDPTTAKSDFAEVLTRFSAGTTVEIRRLGGNYAIAEKGKIVQVDLIPFTSLVGSIVPALAASIELDEGELVTEIVPLRLTPNGNIITPQLRIAEKKT